MANISRLLLSKGQCVPFSFRSLSIPGVIVVEPKKFPDSRGYFMETFKRSDFAAAGIREEFVQDNYSVSASATLRGLHYQKQPHSQGKLVWCLKGAIFDVAVDIRKESPTYGKWVSCELTSDNSHMIYVPPGFAHAFLVLSETAAVLYKCTSEYAPDADRGIMWNDPDIGIQWPIKNPILSEKDAKHPPLKLADNNFRY